MSDYRVLDLFAGLGGFSSAFVESERWEVTTVDIDERFNPDIQADVFELRPSDFSGRAFDVVLALAQAADRELCTHCAAVARQRYRDFREELADEWSGSLW